MKKKIKKQSVKTGLPPGTLVYIGDERKDKISITEFIYNEQNYSENKIKDISKYRVDTLSEASNVWVNVNGVYDVDIISKVGQKFNLHSLILEDVVNTNQRPKTEVFTNSIFTTIKMFYTNHTTGKITWEHLSIILGKNNVVTFQEKPGDVFDVIRERIRSKAGKVRSMKADYLYFALFDAVIDNYFVVLEKMGEKIESIEQEIISNSKNHMAKNIYDIKKELNFLKKSCWPVRESLNLLLREENALISKEINMYLRDLYDHIIQVIDIIETYRDNLSGLMDIYLSLTGNRMNSIMKVLTIISTMFIPLSFLAGLYGMNFKVMPELQYKYGYFILLGVMAAIVSGMLYFFKKKKWF